MLSHTMPYDRVQDIKDTWPDAGPEERAWTLADPEFGPLAREAGVSLDDPYSEYLLAKWKMERATEAILGAGPEIHLPLDEDDTEYEGLDDRDLRGGQFYEGGLDWREKQDIEWMLEEGEPPEGEIDEAAIAALRWAWPHLQGPQREDQLARRPRTVAAAGVSQDDSLSDELYTPPEG